MWLIKNLFYLLFPSRCETCENFLLEEEKVICLKCLHSILYEDNIIFAKGTEQKSDDDILLPFEDVSKNYQYSIKNNDISNNFIYTVYSESRLSLKNKFYGKVPIKYCFAFFKFEQGSKIRYLIHKLKYENIPLIGEILGNIVGNIILQKGYKSYFDLVVPVPLYQNKLRQRGYNQSSIIAKSIAKKLLSQYCDNALIKIAYSKSQTLMKNKWERWQNTSGTFHALKEIIEGKKLLLIDDVITTGATLESCAIELINKGAKEVSIATVAYG